MVEPRLAYGMLGAAAGDVGDRATLQKFQQSSKSSKGRPTLEEIMASPRVRQALSHPQIDATGNVREGAGGVPGSTVTEVDKSVPSSARIGGKTVDPRAFVAVHEQAEEEAMHRLMAGGMPAKKAYDIAHTQYALPAERKAVEAAGVPWDKYESKWRGYLSTTEHETGEQSPALDRVQAQVAGGGKGQPRTSNGRNDQDEDPIRPPTPDLAYGLLSAASEDPGAKMVLRGLKAGARAIAPEATSLMRGEPRPPIENLPEYGKVPEVGDPRFAGALGEAANIGSQFVGPPGAGLAKGALALTMAPAARRLAKGAAKETAEVAGNVGRYGERPMFPQYAEEYPPIAPSVMKPKTKGSTELYEAKGETPEGLAFEKERERIMADMAERGYKPYYDPAKRAMVDPSKYPGRNIDTLTVMPSKPETVAQYLEVTGAPSVREAFRAAYQNGLLLGNAHDWYAMGQLERSFIKELGPQAGRQAFLERFAVPMATTTSGNNPTQNLLVGHYLDWLHNRGAAMPQGAWDTPPTVGARYFMGNVGSFQKAMEGGGYSSLETPKMHNFARSFVGDLDRAVMDEQMVGGAIAPYVEAQGLTKKQAKDLAGNVRTTGYGMIEAPMHEEAKAAGVAPGAFQDVAWAGFKNEPGKPMISHINDAIERTHRLTGMPREEIVRRGLIRKEIPLYGVGGGLLAGPMLQRAAEEQQ